MSAIVYLGDATVRNDKVITASSTIYFNRKGRSVVVQYCCCQWRSCVLSSMSYHYVELLS
ncbi:hypothetical protein PAU_02314 [Photorhabdus asymbiotica]|uniref:Uncharacterized protein n=2 Tax=Photorhabdus asymbiotica TaxID=291112 RepID=C7BKY3_PHOAA|nr:hypothetical protein BDD30_3876 [Photorhabdus asymbiotica]CAQ84406.1 hypothetical protein PAU_02314 [Photorhabdus asymbiotica]